MPDEAGNNGASVAAPRRAVPLARVRNIGIMAHIDAGKTTLTERILYYTGVTPFVGEVHEGTATMDWMIQERERGISITSAATVCPWREHRIHLIDTPGHVDFTAEVERSLRVLDGAVAVFCGMHGVQPQSEKVWRQARRHGIPVIAFVNKMDRPGASLHNVVQSIQAKLHPTPLPIQFPLGDASGFRGVVDLVTMRAVLFDGHHGMSEEPIPAEVEIDAEVGRALLVECLAEIDDVIMDRFLNGTEPTPEELRHALRGGTLRGDVVPVLCGSALHNMGVRLLLDSVLDYLPSPVDRDTVPGIEPVSGRHVCRRVDDDEAFSAVAFKIAGCRRSGRLAYVRIYSGTARPGMVVRNARTGADERLQGVLQVHADQAAERLGAFSGDIAAVTGLSEETRTGDTLCAPDAPIALAPVSFPEPVVSMAVEACAAEDRERLHEALRQIAYEDPTFRVRTDCGTGQTLIAGMGELHLDIVRDRLERDFGVRILVGCPRVNYRETVLRPAAAQMTFVRQTGMVRQYAAISLDVVPLSPGQGFSVSIEAPEERLPSVFVNAVEAGVREAAANGVDGDRPLTDCHVRVSDGAYDAGDSTDLAFRTAAALALRDAVRKGGVTVLEPILAVEVTSPREHMGEVIGDLSSRRGRITEVDTAAMGAARINAHVPLAELFGYATALRSLTRGRADVVAEPSHYEPVPAESTK
ncbi:MAG: elongation factor G [Lentisphaeria bacterium]|nr:elongation factor G [Lentisphaeria bacterium]